MPLHRIDHWATRALPDFLFSRATAPYESGVNDCALFAADGILALTGVDVAEAFRGYTTEQGALKTIVEVTQGSTVEDAAVWCAEKYGMPELEHQLTAHRGDLVLIEDGGTLHLGLVHMNGRQVVSPGDEGLRMLPITVIKRAWRVG